MSQLITKGNQFYLDEKPMQIVSGTVHYFRIPRADWKDRLQKLKACGLNTVETYVAWNVHEPREGEFRFDGEYDIAHFVRLAAELGLYVIVRPGPYVCTEWTLAACLPGCFPIRDCVCAATTLSIWRRLTVILTRFYRG